jgi:hypothetical protein
MRTPQTLSAGRVSQIKIVDDPFKGHPTAIVIEDFGHAQVATGIEGI